jgi:hypothetical protein
MPRKYTRRKPRATTPPTETPRAAPAAARSSPSAPRSPVEESLELWTRFARQTGETVTEYLRRFGDEQQKNYESWSTSLRDATRPTTRPQEVEEVRARLEEWNRRAEEIGARVRDAFQTNLGPQQELFDLWVKPFLPKGATDADRTREANELIQKMWTGLTTDVFRRFFVGATPRPGVEELVRVQEASLKEFSDSFQKLTQLYFTSPAFVTMFGKTLDASLEGQKFSKEQETLFGRMTGFPTRREITELNDALRDLSEKVARMSTGRS